MVGSLQTTSLLKEGLRTWLRSSLPAVDILSPAHVHVDELVPDQMGGRRLLALAELGFSFILDELRQSNLIPLLVIPLVEGTLATRAPMDRASIANQLGAEPPSYYLMSSEAEKLTEDVEEYRVPLSPALFPLIKKAFVYYRVFRDSEAMEKGWEFTRCVYVRQRMDGAREKRLSM